MPVTATTWVKQASLYYKDFVSEKYKLKNS